MRRLLSVLLIFGLIFLFACGSKKSPTGGEKDLVKPTLVATQPDLMGQIKGGKIEIDFSKPMDKGSLPNAIYIYPPVKNSRFNLSHSTLKIELRDELLDDTIYHISFNSALKDLRGNSLDKAQHLSYVNGKPKRASLSGLIEYEDTKDNGSPISLTLFSADSLIVLLDELKGDSYRLPHLNPADYRLRAFIDKNLNGRYDQTAEPFFEASLSVNEVATLNLKMAYSDTTLAQIRSVKQTSPYELEVKLSKEVESIEYVELVPEHGGGEISILRRYLEKDKLLLLTAKQDSLSYRLGIKGLKDKKGNSSPYSSLLYQSRMGEDIEKPKVLSISPRNGATVNSLSPLLKVSFSEIITPERLKAGLQVSETGEEIALKVVENRGRELVLQPIKPLVNYRTHKLIIKKESSDYSGNQLPEDFESVFLPIKR